MTVELENYLTLIDAERERRPAEGMLADEIRRLRSVVEVQTAVAQAQSAAAGLVSAGVSTAYLGPMLMPYTTSPLKFMAPGHFCPDVCGIEDFGPADFWRGRIIRAFFRLMRLWPVR